MFVDERPCSLTLCCYDRRCGTSPPLLRHLPPLWDSWKLFPGLFVTVFHIASSLSLRRTLSAHDHLPTCTRSPVLDSICEVVDILLLVWPHQSMHTKFRYANAYALRNLIGSLTQHAEALDRSGTHWLVVQICVVACAPFCFCRFYHRVMWKGIGLTISTSRAFSLQAATGIHAHGPQSAAEAPEGALYEEYLLLWSTLLREPGGTGTTSSASEARLSDAIFDATLNTCLLVMDTLDLQVIYTCVCVCVCIHDMVWYSMI